MLNLGAVVFFAAESHRATAPDGAGTGRRIAPRRDPTRRFLAEFGRTSCVGSRLICRQRALVILAGCAGLARYNYDDRKIRLPGREFDRVCRVDKIGSNPIIPEYLFIQSSTDLRTPARRPQSRWCAGEPCRVSRWSVLPDPLGPSLEQARTSQAGEVGKR